VESPPHEERNADDAFIADHRNLRGITIFHHIEQRDDARNRKIDVPFHRAGFVKYFAQREIDQFKIGQQGIELDQRQRRQQVVLSDFIRARNERALQQGGQVDTTVFQGFWK
jgi:hypothetical protein